MCGFVCVIADRERFAPPDIARAVASLHHRGPDGHAVEKVAAVGNRAVWFGHARLAILDLSAAGAQPMHVAVEGHAGSIVYNGEIYNHRELAPAITEHIALRSTCDTEVLLAGLLLDGASFLEKTNGMFALAMYDKRDRSVLVARDRLGKKPLFVYDANGVLAFASELKAFHALGLPLTVDDESLAYFRWLGYIPAERSVYRECRKFPASSWARLDLGAARLAVEPKLFWDPFTAMGRTYAGSYETATEEVGALLQSATSLRLDADVPVGIFLSGGVDSSLIAAYTSRKQVASAYIVQPRDAAIDESHVALQTASRLGLTTRVLSVGADDYGTEMDSLAWHYDEPLADLSQLAIMANSASARKDVGVVLTGDGGDEVFLGYPWMRYPDLLLRARAMVGLVPGARRVARDLIRTRAGTQLIRGASCMLGLNPETSETKAVLAHAALADGDPSSLYEYFLVNRHREQLSAFDREVIGGASLLEHVRSWYPRYDWAAAESRSVPELLGALDMLTYMRDAILAKVDRGTMAHGLEARSPFLDWRVVELGMSLPVEFKLAGRKHKRVLRDVCAGLVGMDVSKLRKQGFAIVPPTGVSSGGAGSAEWNTVVEDLWRKEWLCEQGAAQSVASARVLSMPTSQTGT